MSEEQKPRKVEDEIKETIQANAEVPRELAKGHR